jgi:hypothetical protein
MQHIATERHDPAAYVLGMLMSTYLVGALVLWMDVIRF